jgi:hypothetical protein
MKLVEINKIEVKQIRQYKDGILIIMQRSCDGFDCEFYKDNIFETNFFISEDYLMEEQTIIKGMIGITHTIENNKLVELPRKEFEVDRIVRAKNEFQKPIFYIKEKKFLEDGNLYLDTLDVNGNDTPFCNTLEKLREVFEEISDLGIGFVWVNDNLVNKE